MKKLFMRIVAMFYIFKKCMKALDIDRSLKKFFLEWKSENELTLEKYTGSRKILFPQRKRTSRKYLNIYLDH